MNNSPIRDSFGLLNYDPQNKSNVLNKQFASVFSSPADKEVPLLGPKIQSMAQITAITDGVMKLLKNLNPNKSPGPDGIPARLLKELAEELAPIFSVLFQASLNQAKIPHDWKSAFITPIYKKGDRCDASNYRPVSLTSITCKLLEHIIHSNVINHLLSNNVLSDTQHGFRKKRSCDTQLILTIDDLAQSIEDKVQTPYF